MYAFVSSCLLIVPCRGVSWRVVWADRRFSKVRKERAREDEEGEEGLL
jgi:hypothetical protein